MSLRKKISRNNNKIQKKSKKTQLAISQTYIKNILVPQKDTMDNIEEFWNLYSCAKYKHAKKIFDGMDKYEREELSTVDYIPMDLLYDDVEMFKCLVYCDVSGLKASDHLAEARCMEAHNIVNYIENNEL